MRSAALVFLIAACTPASSSDGDDVEATRDSSTGGGGDGSTATIDGPPAVTTDVLPLCQPYARTVTYADGRRQVSTYRYAIIDAVNQGDDVTIETCGMTWTPPNEECPSGATCTGSISPPGVVCLQTDTAEFVGGKLRVFCGLLIESYAANGSSTGMSGYAYQSIRVTY